MGNRGSRRALVAGILAVAAGLIVVVSASGVVGPTGLVSAPTGVTDPNPDDITYVGASKDGAHVFFTTAKSMVAGDRDSNRVDVYERFKGKTTLMSGPTGVPDPNTTDAKFAGVTDDGGEVFFETKERLAPKDSDGGKTDVYSHKAGGTDLASTTTGNDPDPGTGTAVFGGVSRDGTRMFFETDQTLTPDDTDGGNYDLYERFGDGTRLVSGATKLQEPAGAPGGNFYAGSTYDGKRVFFETFQKLDPDDTDEGKIDVYSHAGDLTALESISSPGTGEENVEDIHFAASSADGHHLYFATKQRMAGDDNDSHWIDLYERFNNDTRLASGPTDVIDPDNNNIIFKALSEDGNIAYFETRQRLSADDTDNGQADVYERSAGKTKLVSKGLIPSQGDHDAAFGGASIDGSHVFFSTKQRLTTDDRDPAGKALVDVYERAGGSTFLSSKPTGLKSSRGFDAAFGGMSLNGNRVFFTTNQRLTRDDFDKNRNDIYERAGRLTSLVSRPSDKPDPDLLGPSTFRGSSRLGSIVFFTTRDPLSVKDKDGRRNDLYFAGSPDPGRKPTNVAPRVSKVRVKGSRITFRLSERATVRFTFSKRSGKRYRGVKGGFSVKVNGGTRSVRFKTRGRLGKGSFRIKAVAKDSRGKRSKPATRKFRIR
jgi:hypothetical protein